MLSVQVSKPKGPFEIATRKSFSSRERKYNLHSFERYELTTSIEQYEVKGDTMDSNREMIIASTCLD